MKKNRYSKIADFRIVDILTKSYKRYFNVPKDKNNYYHRYQKLFDVIFEKNKNNSDQVRLKNEYKITLNNLICRFNNNSNEICKLTQNNIFTFLLILSEVCLENKLQERYQNYIYDINNNLTKFNQDLDNCFKNAINSIFFCHHNSTLNISQLTRKNKINLLKLILLLKPNQFHVSEQDLRYNFSNTFF